MKYSIEMQNQKLASALIFLLFSFTFYAQQITVLDADSGIPVDNVALFNKDQSKTTITDSRGNTDLGIFGESVFSAAPTWKRT